MLDWNITEDDTPLPSETEDGPPPAPAWRRWLWLVVVIVVALGVGGVYITNRAQRGDEAIRTDLLAFIRAEEQARRLGVRDRAGEFAWREAPQIWRETYRNTFRVPVASEGVTVTLESLVIVADTATVVVRVKGQSQRRAYRLTADGWRRIPLTDYSWGETSTLTDTTTGVALTFTESDRAFAETFFADLPRFWETYGALRGDRVPPAPLAIEPVELRGALLNAQSEEDRRVVLNSPQVVEVPTHWHLSGAAAVRYTFAEFALRPLLTRGQLSRTVPNYGRFLDAAKHVLALRWATSPDEYAALMHQWRTIALSEPWSSPLSSLVTMDDHIDPFAPDTMEARLLTMADEVAAEGNTNLSTVIGALAGASNWDEAFQTTSYHSALALEQAAQGLDDTTTSPLPLTGRLLPAPALPPQQLSTFSPRFAISHILPKGSDRPVLLEGLERATLSVTMPDGSALDLPNACISLFTEATLDGEWQEAGLRLRVTHVTINTLFPSDQFDIAPAPADAIAYIGVNNRSQSQPVQFTSIVAVRPDGNTTPVLSTAYGGINLYGFFLAKETRSAGVLLVPTRIDPLCRAMWVAWYTPEEGITGQWFITWEAQNTYPNIRWDPVTNRGLLTLVPNDDSDTIPFWWLTPDTPPILGAPDGIVPYIGQPTLLQPGKDAVLMVNPIERTYTLVPLSRSERQVAYSPSPLQYASEITFDSTGTELLLGVTDSNGFPPASVVMRYTGEDPVPDTLWGPTQGIFMGATADTQQPLFYGFASQDGTATTLIRLGDGSPQALAVDTDDERLLNVIACQEGGISYLGVARGNGDGPFDGVMRLHGLRADGTPRHDPVTLPPDATLLMCP